jgi:putative ABC transport system permease protein
MAIHFYLRDVLRQTFQTLWAHKLRSFLTMFGITWGVMSLLLLGAVGQGFRIGQRQRLANLGEDLIFIFGGRVSVGAGAGQSERWVYLTEEDCRLTASQLSAVRACTPILSRGNVRAETQANNVAFEVFGIMPNYQGMRYTPLGRGRLISREDQTEGRRVVVLGEEVRKQLFPSGEAVGQKVRLNQIPFDVVGLLAMVGKEGNSGTNMRLFIPLDDDAASLSPPRRGDLSRRHLFHDGAAGERGPAHGGVKANPRIAGPAQGFCAGRPVSTRFLGHHRKFPAGEQDF